MGLPVLGDVEGVEGGGGDGRGVMGGGGEWGELATVSLMFSNFEGCRFVVVALYLFTLIWTSYI